MTTLADELQHLTEQGQGPAARRIGTLAASLTEDLTQAIHERDIHHDDAKALQVRLSLVANECDGLRADLARERERVTAAEFRARHHEAIVDELKRAQAELWEANRRLAAVNAGVEHVWFWEGQGDDAGSLSCPVVMQPETLRAFIERAERAERIAEDTKQAHHRLCLTAQGWRDRAEAVEIKAAAYDRLRAHGAVLLSEASALVEYEIAWGTIARKDVVETANAYHREGLARVLRAQSACIKAALEAVPVEALVSVIHAATTKHATSPDGVSKPVAEAVRARLLAALTEATDPQAGGGR